jgi:hypothetical protein
MTKKEEPISVNIMNDVTVHKMNMMIAMISHTAQLGMTPVVIGSDSGVGSAQPLRCILAFRHPPFSRQHSIFSFLYIT